MSFLCKKSSTEDMYYEHFFIFIFPAREERKCGGKVHKKCRKA